MKKKTKPFLARIKYNKIIQNRLEHLVIKMASDMDLEAGRSHRLTDRRCSNAKPLFSARKKRKMKTEKPNRWEQTKQIIGSTK